MKSLKNQILILSLFLLIPLISCGQTINGKKERLNFKIQNEVVFYKGSPFSGKVVCYYENDKLQSETFYKEGKRDGKWVEYFKDGTVADIVNYKNGYLNGLYESYYENGQLNYRMTFINNKLDGVYEDYYPDGKKEEIRSYKVGLKEGDWMGYFSNGKLEYKESFTNDLRDGIFEYYSLLDGSLEMKYSISNGKFLEMIFEKSDEGDNFFDFSGDGPEPTTRFAPYPQISCIK
jgi:antitoxin component YwqK of YwqJK toxin-antitoxin module